MLAPLSVLLALLAPPARQTGDWSQGPGPNGDWSVAGVPAPPLAFSARTGAHVRWRVPLSETGQGGIAIVGERLFVATMAPWDETPTFDGPFNKQFEPFLVQDGAHAVLVRMEPFEPDTFFWRTPRSARALNSRGLEVTGDERSRWDGWDWVFNGSPTRVNERLHFTLASGLVYVLDARTPAFDASALLALADLGPSGSTWTANSLSCAAGRLYHRTAAELLCFE